MKVMYLMMGTPGVGKSTWIQQMSEEIYGNDYLMNFVVSPDDLRKIIRSPELKPNGRIGISPNEEGYVWSLIWQILDKKTERGELVLVDATHSRESAFSQYKTYRDAGYRIYAIDFRDYATLDEILIRNNTREELKFVPPDRIETIYERLKTVSPPGWIEIIKPEDFKEHYQSIKFNFDKYEKIHFFGDIHSCYDEFRILWDKMNIDKEKDFIVFVGDYFDRGPKAVETLEKLFEIKKEYNSLFLMGNHEEPLRFYKELYEDFNKVLIDWIQEFALPKIEECSKIAMAQKEQNAEPCIETDEKLNIILKEYLKKRSYRNIDNFKAELKKFPKAWEAFEGLVQAYRLPTHLRKNLDTGTPKIRGTSIKTIKEFFLSNFKYTEIMDFIKGCGQLFYGDFHNKTIFATHGGLPILPDKSVPTANLIRGVGDYGDALECMTTFHKNYPDVIQLHGHRNLENLPIEVIKNKIFNINGDVDVGLRSVTLLSNGENITYEVQPTVETKQFFREQQLKKAQMFKAKKLSIEDESKGVMQLFQDHQHIDVKKLPNNIASINFTKKAFQHGVWDQFTIKARGLFMAIDPQEQLPKDYVIARGYEKFFNVGEKYGFSDRDIRNLAFPITAYDKANGYLGILAVDNRDSSNPQWFFASKTTTEGEFAQIFKDLVEPFLTEDLKNKLIEKNLTLLFEVIHPEFDPHIVEYPKKSLVLLDGIKNKIEFEKISFKELIDIFDTFNTGGQAVTEIDFKIKEPLVVLETFADYYGFVKTLNSASLFLNNYIEGVVFEDDSGSAPNMFKLKTDWYSFWKYMRGFRDRIISRIKKDTKPGQNPTIEKSNLNKLKAHLHTAEAIKVFNFMLDWALNDFETFQKTDIIQIRKKFIEQYK